MSMVEKEAMGKGGSSNNSNDSHVCNVECYYRLKVVIRTSKISKSPKSILLMRGEYGKTESEDECLANRVEDNQILCFSFAFSHGRFKGGKRVMEHVTGPSFVLIFFGRICELVAK